MAPSSTIPTRPVQTLEGQAAPVSALPALLKAFPGLPAPYITIHRDGEVLGLSLFSPADFEEWRVALKIPDAAVRLDHRDGQRWLTAEGVAFGVEISLLGHGIAGGVR